MIRGLTAEEKQSQIDAARQGLQTFADACKTAWENTDDPRVLNNILKDIKGIRRCKSSLTFGWDDIDKPFLKLW
jgi:hypothetical protein